jgi:hypothetical protein
MSKIKWKANISKNKLNQRVFLERDMKIVFKSSLGGYLSFSQRRNPRLNVACVLSAKKFIQYVNE